MSKCIGCGVKIQTTDPLKKGYTPEIVLIEQGEEVYCKRCYDIRHHNKLYDTVITDEYYYKNLSFIKDTKSLIIYLVDVLNIETSFIPNLKDIIGNNPILILINKIDVMPKSLKLKNIEKFTFDYAKANKLNIIGTMLISSKNKKNIGEVIERIKRLRIKKDKTAYYKPGYKPGVTDVKKEKRFDDCYVMGCTSVGKSTFINALIEYTNPNVKNRLTTSNQYHTTQDMIKIPLDSKNYIIDTPGIINKSSYCAYLDHKSQKIITPTNYIKPRTYQLNPSQTIFIGALARIDFIEGENISASFYLANDLYLHRTKLEKADSIMEKLTYNAAEGQTNNLLVPPFSNAEIERLGKNTSIEYNIQDTTAKPYDLEFPGLGFVHLNGKNLKIKVTFPQNVKIKLRESII